MEDRQWAKSRKSSLLTKPRKSEFRESRKINSLIRPQWKKLRLSWMRQGILYRQIKQQMNFISQIVVFQITSKKIHLGGDRQLTKKLISKPVREEWGKIQPFIHLEEIAEEGRDRKRRISSWWLNLVMMISLSFLTLLRCPECQEYLVCLKNPRFQIETNFGLWRKSTWRDKERIDQRANESLKRRSSECFSIRWWMMSNSIQKSSQKLRQCWTPQH